jgi:hypothetical protein
MVREFTREAVTLYRDRRGLLRSLFLRARIDPVIQEAARLVNAHLTDRLLLLLLPRVSEIRHPDPRRAIELGYLIIVGALREMTLFGEAWPSANPDGVDLTDELTRLFLGYLGVSASGGPS